MTDPNSHNQQVIAAFRSNGGKVDEGRPLLLLTTTGAKSGNLHTTPVMYLAEGDRVFVFASRGGAPTNPDWYRNLTANPSVTVELGGETFTATACPLPEPERSRLYSEQAKRYPNFAEYQAKTTRPIPVVELQRQ
jgi:deazaflavin-dependent oxidoreductase (nitroreductase family)